MIHSWNILTSRKPPASGGVHTDPLFSNKKRPRENIVHKKTQLSLRCTRVKQRGDDGRPLHSTYVHSTPYVSRMSKPGNSIEFTVAMTADHHKESDVDHAKIEEGR